jgi:uncharacterized membrane protein
MAKASVMLAQQQAVHAAEGQPLAPSEVANRIFAIYEAGDLITACAWCKRVEIDSEWHLAPHAALAAIEERYTLSHSICQVCARGPAN